MRVSSWQKLSEEDILKFRQSSLYKHALRGYAYSETAIKYNLEYFPGQHENHSMIVWNDKSPVLWLPAFCSGELFSNFGSPVEVFEDPDQGTLLTEAYKHLLKYFNEYIRNNSFQLFRFADNPYLLGEFYDSATVVKESHVGSIDLKAELAVIKSCIRKSFKSLINWGEKELKVVVIDVSNFKVSDIEQFRDFHVQVAGRKTRSDRSWEIQGEMVSSGEAFIVFGFLHDKLVSAGLYVHGSGEVYYGVGVYDRDLMSQNLALAHYPLFKAIEESKRLGKEWFLLGEVGTTHPDQKENQIARFKKGFASRCHVARSYESKII